MTMKRRIAGYVKLAELWNKRRAQALAYHQDYFTKMFADSDTDVLVGTYIDITGNKSIKKRPQMIRLLSDCAAGKVDIIYSQTKGYLAANTREFCYLIKFLFELDTQVDILTEDFHYHMDTLDENDNQREELYRMASEYCHLTLSDYSAWKGEIQKAIKKLKGSE